MTDLSFKGQRDYLNGETIFDYIVDKFFWGITPPKDINFYINSMTKKKIEVFPIDPRSTTKRNIIGGFNSDQVKLLICEGDEEITQRTPYDENKLKELSSVDGNKIIIPQELSGFSPIERIISGYKILLLSIFQDSHGKFIFARLLLDSIPSGDISIVQERIISNRYFQGKIQDNAGKIGTIYFGVHKK